VLNDFSTVELHTYNAFVSKNESNLRTNRFLMQMGDNFPSLPWNLACVPPRAPQAPSMRRNVDRLHSGKGLGLIELLCALAVLGVLAALGIPALGRMVASSAVASHAQLFLIDSRYARSEALRRGVNVTLCRALDPEAPSPVCAGTSTGGGWERGWLVFVDQNADNRRQPDEAVLRVQGALPDSGGISRNGGVAYNQLRYRPNGWSMAAQATMRFMPRTASGQADAQLVRTVCVSIVGRTRLLPPDELNCL
jgi:type IV fimbrial biogenesis protein FimT